ncbi:MAG: alpha/beta fold hydrolase [Bacteroidota bacterium]
MKKFLKFFLGSIALLVVVYFLGPKQPAPNLETPMFKLPGDLVALEQMINDSERSTKGIKPDNQARIVWADSTKKEKTKVAFLYLHGFTASQGDGMPVHTNIAKTFNSNIFLFRNAHHGVNLGDSTMLTATPNDFIFQAEKALAIAKQLGDEVIVMGTSLGGALTLHLASKHPEIKAIVLYAPAVVWNSMQANIVTGPWGYQILKATMGSEYINNPDTSVLHQKYWQMHVHIKGIASVVNVVKYAQDHEPFENIKCPVFMGYYYKNEQEQDNAMSPKLMLKMFDKLGTPADQKKQVAFPEAGDHVIASELISGEWRNVEKETENWLRETVKLSANL